MYRQLIFSILLILTLGVFGYTLRRILFNFRLARPFQVGDFWKRCRVVFDVAFSQTKIFRRPVVGLAHALVFWGFLWITVGSIEMVIDGVTGSDKALSSCGLIYRIVTASGDVYAIIVFVAILAFVARRVVLHIRRFAGIEMKHTSHVDALLSLDFILLLMASLLVMNTSYLLLNPGVTKVSYPFSHWMIGLFGLTAGSGTLTWYEASWWTHILLIFAFANYLPYSKHFHVFMSVPAVFFSRVEPLGKMDHMESVAREVKLMLHPELAAEGGDAAPAARFGVLDAEDVTRKNYLDSLACTECGRCTSVCPANITGKKLSPRKVMMDLRARMKEKGSGLRKNGPDFTDGKALIGDYISAEELWACTTCNACARECPININQPSLILEMRRYLVMEQAAAPGELNAMFTNIGNNGAPWQFPPEDRMLWGSAPVMADLAAAGKSPEWLFWVGCAGAFDDRYRKVTRAFVKVLDHLKVSYGVLGPEETCNGDPARRAGNEMLFQMQAMSVIETLEKYGVRKILTACPHCFNIFRNEYPDLGGHYEVVHHSQFLRDQVESGKLKLPAGTFDRKKIVFHDPCYLGRGNGEYGAPRKVLHALSSSVQELPRHKSAALCCGAGGGQMFKEAEKGEKEVFIERIEEVIDRHADIVATACPFCMTMLTDGIKYKNREETLKNYDIAELVAMALE